MKRLWFLFLLPTSLGSFMCYQCATDSAVLNWSRYRLPMQQGDSMIGDDSCFSEDKVQSHVPCSGVCVTANITTDSGHVAAVVRDCQYFSPRKQEELAATEDNCITKEVIVKRKTMFVRYCYCQGDFCNGRQPLRRSYRTRPSPDLATTHAVGVGVLLSLILVYPF